MSIFSRLFSKTQENDGEKPDESKSEVASAEKASMAPANRRETVKDGNRDEQPSPPSKTAGEVPPRPGPPAVGAATAARMPPIPAVPPGAAAAHRHSGTVKAADAQVPPPIPPAPPVTSPSTRGAVVPPAAASGVLPRGARPVASPARMPVAAPAPQRPALSNEALGFTAKPPSSNERAARPAAPAPAVTPPAAKTKLPAFDPHEPATEKSARAPLTTSVRPSAPPPFLPAEDRARDAMGSIADTFDRLLASEVDAMFTAIKHDSARPPAPAQLSSTDLLDVRELFAELAANHMRQVRDFMIDLTWGEASRDWIAICEPSVRSLCRAADKLDQPTLSRGLAAFGQALEAAAASPGAILEGEPKDAILARYAELADAMPKAFALDMDRSQREAVILQSLLLQIPEVKKATIDKLYAAGLTSLDVLYLAKADDLVATTGIPTRIAERIVDKFRAHRAEVQSATLDATRAHEREKIEELVSMLSAQHLEFEKAAESWSDDATERKRKMRRARSATLLQINVLLARLGEVKRLRDIERLPFERKLDELHAFLAEAKEKYVAGA